jgi:hypothetical protein
MINVYSNTVSEIIIYLVLKLKTELKVINFGKVMQCSLGHRLVDVSEECIASNFRDKE